MMVRADKKHLEIGNFNAVSLRRFGVFGIVLYSLLHLKFFKFE